MACPPVVRALLELYYCRLLGWSDTPRIKYIMFLPDTPLLLLATVVRGVNTLLG